MKDVSAVPHPDRLPAPPPPPREEPKKSKSTGSGKGKRAGFLAAAIILAGSAATAGSLLTDPTASEEYVALSSQRDTLSTELQTSQSKYESLESRYETLSSGMEDRESAVTEREDAVSTAETNVEAAETAVKARETAVKGEEDKKAANTITDGTWTVGLDVEPGSYRSAAPVSSTCYWAVLRSGSNGSDILENDLPGGGRPVVTLAEGQDFNSSRCGKWTKQ